MSHKHRIEMWFDCYKLALRSGLFESELKNSREYYKDWGDCRGQSFKKWWHSHRHLFEITEVEPTDRHEEDPSFIYVRVPIGTAVGELQRQLKDLIETRQRDREGERLMALTQKTELRADHVEHAFWTHHVYTRVEDRPVNKEFYETLQTFYEAFLQRHYRERRLKVPANIAGFERYPESAEKACRANIKQMQNLMRAAAAGDFPGRGYSGTGKSRARHRSPNDRGISN